MTMQPWCQGGFSEFSKPGRQLCIEKATQKEWRSKITLGKQQGEHRQQLLGSHKQSGLGEHGLAYHSINTLADGLAVDGSMEDTNCSSPLNLPFSAPSLLPWPWLGRFSSSSGFRSSSICTTVLTLHTCDRFWTCWQLSLSAMGYDPLLPLSLPLPWLGDWSLNLLMNDCIAVSCPFQFHFWNGHILNHCLQHPLSVWRVWDGSNSPRCEKPDRPSPEFESQL